MSYDTDRFLDSVRRAITLPSNQNRFDDPDLLALGDEETEAVILPVLLSIRQDFLVKMKEVAVVAETAKYKIPYRAVGRKLRDLKLSNSDGTIIRSIPYINPVDRAAFSNQTLGSIQGFTVEGENIVLLPTPSSSGELIQMYYELAPSRLVSTTEAGQISGINTTTGDVTISTAVTDFVTGQTMDLIDGKSGNTVLAEDIVNTSVASTVITFDPADLPDSLAVGDYVALSDESPVVQLPDELIQSLVLAVVARIMEAQGDIELLDRAVARLQKKLKAAAELLTPRVEGVQQVVIQRNGLLRQRPYTYRYRASS